MKLVKTALAVLALTLVLAALPAEAQAQVVTSRGIWSYPYLGGRPTFTPTYVPSYSYWTAAYYGYPPRIYQGLGLKGDDFPYYGRAYGSPSDPWSWPAMAGYGAGIPTRYYVVLP